MDKQKLEEMVNAARGKTTGIVLIETDAVGLAQVKEWAGPKLFRYDVPKDNVVFRGAMVVDSGRKGFRATKNRAILRA